MDILKDTYILHAPCKNIPYIYKLRKAIKQLKEDAKSYAQLKSENSKLNDYFLIACKEIKLLKEQRHRKNMLIESLKKRLSAWEDKYGEIEDLTEV